MLVNKRDSRLYRSLYFLSTSYERNLRPVEPKTHWNVIADVGERRNETRKCTGGGVCSHSLRKRDRSGAVKNASRFIKKYAAILRFAARVADKLLFAAIQEMSTGVAGQKSIVSRNGETKKVVAKLLMRCGMILRSEKRRLIGAGAPVHRATVLFRSSNLNCLPAFPAAQNRRLRSKQLVLTLCGRL